MGQLSFKLSVYLAKEVKLHRNLLKTLVPPFLLFHFPNARIPLQTASFLQEP